LNFEITRQRSLASTGIQIKQETRHWDDIRRITISLRTKEEEQDYRYFPEADLLPVLITKRFLQTIRQKMPEMPKERAKRFQKDYKISNELAQVLVKSKALADFFEAVASHSKDPREAGGWLAVDLQAYLKEVGANLEDLEVTPEYFAELSNIVSGGEISRSSAKTVFFEMMKTGKKPRAIAEAQGLKVIADMSFVKEVVDQVFRDNPQAVQDALNDDKAVNFLIGKIMRETRGRVDPGVANRIVRGRLASDRSS
jgi:aspartyl-tRNA(Asn)/glutamyl-tRNA(Gln) amidotransferase subunit B